MVVCVQVISPQRRNDGVARSCWMAVNITRASEFHELNFHDSYASTFPHSSLLLLPVLLCFNCRCLHRRQALRWVLEGQKGAASLLPRRLRVATFRSNH